MPQKDSTTTQQGSVLLCGADGFIGRHIEKVLRARGYLVVRAVRKRRLPGDIGIDYHKDTQTEVWVPRLRGIDAVVNAVGILVESQHGDFDKIHQQTPQALFAACAAQGIPKVVQISALGEATTPYLQSKRTADAFLLQTLPDSGVVLRPSVVFGVDAAATRFFLTLAGFPLHANLLGAGKVQPVHVQDLAELVGQLLQQETTAVYGVVQVPGPVALTYRQWLAAYRAMLGLGKAWVVPVPAWCSSVLAQVMGWVPRAIFTPDTWAMLRAGNVGDATQAQTILGRTLRLPQAFLTETEAASCRKKVLAKIRITTFVVLLAVAIDLVILYGLLVWGGWI